MGLSEARPGQDHHPPLASAGTEKRRLETQVEFVKGNAEVDLHKAATAALQHAFQRLPPGWTVLA